MTMYFYTDVKREGQPHALPNAETHYNRTEDNFFVDEEGNPLPVGWYYAYGQIGCLWDSAPIGPFDTEEEAIADARANEPYDESEDDAGETVRP
jgi:hypothetical protein